jgi:serine/threonine protein kinase
MLDVHDERMKLYFSEEGRKSDHCPDEGRPTMMTLNTTTNHEDRKEDHPLDSRRRLSLSKLKHHGKALFKRIVSPSSIRSSSTSLASPIDVKSPSNFVPGYSRLKTIGEGAFGKVVLAAHQRTGECVAIKCIRKHRLLFSTEDEMRMEREVQALKCLRHESIIELYEIFENEQHEMLYLVLEYANQGELFDYIVAKGKLEECEARRLFRGMLEAVQYCHNRDFVHRDLKPENFLLDEEYRVKLIDFGFSHHNDMNHMHKTYCGSPAYAAPEMLAGQTYKGALADVWSLGVILFSMICGFLPFDDTCVTKMYVNIVKGDFEIPGHVSEGKEFGLYTFRV